MLSHGAPIGSPVSFGVKISSFARAKCLSRPPNVQCRRADPALEPGDVEAVGLPPEGSV
jgi:hypothetical protein